MSYNYLEAVKGDIEDVLDDYIGMYGDDVDADEIRQRLNADLWTDDSVTGNGSGSYTFNREEAKKYLFDSDDGLDILKEAVSEFGTEAEDVVDHFMSEDWEYFDVTIRCYILAQAIDEVLEERGIVQVIYNETIHSIKYRTTDV